MKKLLLIFIVLISFAMSAIVTATSTKKISTLTKLLEVQGVEALTYSNEGPGKQGERHAQAVWCSSFWNGWMIVEGCCYGWENCSYINCPSHSFSCNGNDWISF